MTRLVLGASSIGWCRVVARSFVVSSILAFMLFLSTGWWVGHVEGIFNRGRPCKTGPWLQQGTFGEKKVKQNCCP